MKKEQDETEENQANPNMEEDFEDIEKLGYNSDKAFFSYLGSAYSSFLSGDDALYTSLEDTLVQNFESGNLSVERALSQISNDNELLRTECDELEKMSTALPELEKREAEVSERITASEP